MDWKRGASVRDGGLGTATTARGGPPRGEPLLMTQNFHLSLSFPLHRVSQTSPQTLDNLKTYLLVLNGLFNMSNGTVNGSTGIESKFGMSITSTLVAITRLIHFLSPFLIASLGLNGRSAYVPPHMRSSQRAASSPVVPTTGCVHNVILSLFSLFLPYMGPFRNGWNDSRDGSSDAPSAPRAFGGGGYARGGRGGGYGGGYGGGRGGDSNGSGPPSNQRETAGYGIWRDGKHVAGARHPRMEKELFGEVNDPSKQQTGINFEKYDDIPVEATGAGVPEPVLEFTNPPLDPVLLENIGYARYTQPTPVQKYSIPIVALNRDLMACAQVS